MLHITGAPTETGNALKTEKSKLFLGSQTLKTVAWVTWLIQPLWNHFRNKLDKSSETQVSPDVCEHRSLQLFNPDIVNPWWTFTSHSWRPMSVTATRFRLHTHSSSHFRSYTIDSQRAGDDWTWITEEMNKSFLVAVIALTLLILMERSV